MVAYLALFVALGGTTWAAAKIGSNDIKRNAVKSKHIKNETVKQKDIRDNAVGAGEIADGTVGSAEIADGAVASIDVADDGLTGADISESTLGLVPNADQVDGRSASDFVDSSVYRRESPVSAGTLLADGTFVQSQACFAGDVLLSGGQRQRHIGSARELPRPGRRECLAGPDQQERQRRRLQRGRSLR